MPDQVVSNKRRSWLLTSGFIALVALVVLALSWLLGAGGLAGLAIACGVAAATGLAAYWSADRVALRVSRARPADEDEYKRYHNLVEGLCVASGLPKPRLYVIDDPAPNAFVAGRNHRRASLAVTTGMVEKMNRVELEGVLAHELAHVKNHDVLVSTLAVTMVGAVTVLADLGIRLRWWGMGRLTHQELDRSRGRQGGPGAVLSLLGFGLLAPAPLVARVMRFTISPRRDVLADVAAIEMTRYPPGLLAALEKLRDDSTVVASTSHATSQLWIGEPAALTPEEGRISGINRMFASHPPLDERIALLREL